jgi:16S rRNA (cytosine967-C5)-methyltransferase
MAPAKNISARRLGLNVLDTFDAKTANAADILHAGIDRTTQKAQATDIVFGVIRNRSALDLIITKIAKTPLERIHKKLINILRIGIYELVFAPRTAEYAILNEAVQLAHDLTGKKQAGFVNVTLRNITRNILDRSAPLTDTYLSQILPHSPHAGCKFAATLLPDPKTAPAEYLHHAFSLPKWLVAEWLKEFAFEKTRRICFASNRRPSLFVHPNTLKITQQGLLEKLNSENPDIAEFTDSELLGVSDVIRIKASRPVSQLPGFDEGLFIVQDPAAASVTAMLAPKPGQTIIDLCAAPGTKTVRMAQAMNDQGKIIATDIDPERLQKVDRNCARLGITIVKTVPLSSLQKAVSELPAPDAVLLDVPCSNTGVLARRPEVRLKITKKTVSSLADTQLKLLNDAAKLITPGAQICYSTCSIQKKENCRNVQKFLTQNPDFELKFQKLTLPAPENDITCDHDGGYVALIVKKNR